MQSCYYKDIAPTELSISPTDYGMAVKKNWIPAFAGMTKKEKQNSCHSFFIRVIRVLLFLFLLITAPALICYIR